MTGPPQARPFRAGLAGLPAGAQVPAGMVEAARPSAAAPKTYLGDVSEFQPDIADAAYLRWSQAIIIRAAYGAAHDDQAWYGGQRRDLLHAGGAKFLGIYQYLVAGQDPVAQAKALAKLVGTLRTGEKIICDLEEGAGSQRARRNAWANVIAGELGDTSPWTYSGRFFAANAGLAPVDWIAAYQSAAPPEPHTLWQFTSSFAVPGVGTCDCSVFSGTTAQLAALAHGGQAGQPLIRQGAAGPAVKLAQQRLNTWGAKPALAADGVFGPATAAAVTAFQHARKLTADAVIGPATWAALQKNP